MKRTIQKLGLVSLLGLALAGCGKYSNDASKIETSSPTNRFDQASKKYFAAEENYIENGIMCIPFKDVNGNTGITAKKDGTNVYFFDLLADGRLQGIDIGTGTYDRNWKLPENIKELNDSIGDSADRSYKNFWKEYSRK